MMYKFAFRHAMLARFPHAFDYSYPVSQKYAAEQEKEIHKLQKECVMWLKCNLLVNYTYEIVYEDGSIDDGIIDYFKFRDESDLLAFKLRFGL